VRIGTPRGVGLAAEVHRNGPSVVVMAHGFCSDRHSRGRFDRLVRDFTGIGLSVVTFDFSGCGESDDDVITLAHEVEDLRAVIGYVREEGMTDIALHGHSLGGSVCLSAYDEGITTIVTTGTATGPMHYDWSEIYTAEQLREITETGFTRDGRHVISQQTLDDFAQRDQRTLLDPVKAPVLLIHGDNDPEERQLLALSRQAVLPGGSRLEVVEGAGHSFEGHMDEVSALALEWYATHLRLP
jgi:pimeloyl-ACP methyl ester carboxylesterase